MSADTLAPLRCRDLGVIDYHTSWQAMKTFTETRDAATMDEVWLLEHPRVFTQGQAGKAEHVLAAGDIPVVQTDRGGQVTYHGPGQLTAYLLLDLKRLKLGVRELVHGTERAIIDVLFQWGVSAAADPQAPGVYIAGDKIAALGLRVRKGRSFHGLALNLDVNLEPFSRINPCGYAGMQVTRLMDHSHYTTADLEQVKQQLSHAIGQQFGLTVADHKTGLPTFEVKA